MNPGSHTFPLTCLSLSAKARSGVAFVVPGLPQESKHD